jgi:hypothetical protein
MWYLKGGILICENTANFKLKNTKIKIKNQSCYKYVFILYQLNLGVDYV